MSSGDRRISGRSLNLTKSNHRYPTTFLAACRKVPLYETLFRPGAGPFILALFRQIGRRQQPPGDHHHGFGDPIDRVSGFLNDLLNAGYDVLAFNALGHGGTLAFVDSDQDGIREHARQSGKSNIFHEMSHFERPSNTTWTCPRVPSPMSRAPQLPIHRHCRLSPWAASWPYWPRP